MAVFAFAFDTNAMKTCGRCRQSLPVDAYHRSTRSADGLQRMCKACGNDARRERLERDRAAVRGALPTAAGKRCPRCREVKPHSAFHRNRRAKDGLQTYCPPCSNEVRREYEHRNAPELAARRDERLARAAVTGEKRCTKCGEGKPVVEFYRHRGTSDGRATYCILCVKADRRAWVESNADKVRQQNERYRTENPEKRRRDHRQFWLKAYGLTQDEYSGMLSRQHAVCAICQEPERYIDKRTGERRNLSVDHDHKTGRVRGLLCGACNRGIGQFADDPDRLLRVIDYLRGAIAPDYRG
jgi:ribosomal protein L32